MKIAEVNDPRTTEQFLALPAALYAGDPTWHDGAFFSAAADLAGESAFCRYATLCAFLCLDEVGSPLGRIAAFVNPRLRDEGGRPLGQVGYFEAVDDPRAAGALFEAAESWLRARGAGAVVGPMAGGAHRTHRLMTSGFARTPFFAEPRGQAHYPCRFETAGYLRMHTWSSYDWTIAEEQALLARIRPAAEQARESGRWRLEAPDLRRPDRLFPRLHQLLDRVWSGHTGYASMDLAELAEGFGALLAMMDDRCLALAVDVATGRDVGLAFIWPDHLDAIRQLGHDPSRLARWLAEEARALPRSRRIVHYLIAIAPEVRRTGLAAWLVQEFFGLAVERGYEEALVALVDETFTLFGKVAPPTRTYALYAKGLAR